MQDQVARYPALLLLDYAVRRRATDLLVKGDTNLLIEGFPRSGNTFAVWAFRLTNPNAKFAHHVHTSSHVRLAMRHGVPSLILIRAPEDAVRSLLVRRPEIPPEIALRRYIQFYRTVETFRNYHLVARFESVTKDFNRVVDAVNRRFNTKFHGFDAQVRKEDVFEAIDSDNRRGHGGHINARFVPRPHPERDRLKQRTSLVDCGPQLREAETLYKRLIQEVV